MIRILVLDDEEGNLDQLTEFFDYRGYKVFGETTGRGAIETYDKEDPQLLLLDIRMPNEDGMDVLKHVRSKDKAAKIMMITALRDEETKKEAFALGADEYVLKPFNYEEVEGLVIKMVNEVIAEGKKVV
ncbi:MAG: response regulator [Candidatus Omnitrophota bacterium]